MVECVVGLGGNHAHAYHERIRFALLDTDRHGSSTDLAGREDATGSGKALAASEWSSQKPGMRSKLHRVISAHSGTIRVAVLALSVKLILLAYGWLAYVLVPQETRVTPVEPHLGTQWLSIWSQWDVAHYLSIAEDGYRTDAPFAMNFFPLFPLVMRAAGLVTGNNFFAGLLISNVAAIVAVVLLYQLTLLRLKDEPTAFRCALYCLIFPAAFYTSTAYSEGLYLLVTVASFYAMEKRRWLWAGIAGGMASATRIAGIMIAVPLILGYALAARERRRFVDRGVLLIPFIMAGIAGVMYMYWRQTGDPLAFLHIQATLGNRAIAFPLATFWQGWEVLNWKHIVTGFEENYTTNALNWGAGVLFLILGIAAFRMLGVTYGIYILAALLMPTSFTLVDYSPDRPLISMLRFTSVVFPGFMVLAVWGRNPAIDRLITIVFLLFLGLLTGLFLRSWNVAGVS